MNNLRIFCLLLAWVWSAQLGAVAGKVDSLVGDAAAVDQDGSHREMVEGDGVDRGDTLYTYDGRMELAFTDGGKIKLGRYTIFKVDDYQYAALDGEDTGVFSLLKGALRAVSGAIGKKRREEYRINTPVATVGLRGTEFYLRYCKGDCLRLSDGLYSSVSDGGIFLRNKTGTVDVWQGQAAFVADPATLPRLIVPPPPFIKGDLAAAVQTQAMPNFQPVWSGQFQGVVKPPVAKPQVKPKSKPKPKSSSGYNPLDDPGMGTPGSLDTGQISQLSQAFQAGSIPSKPPGPGGSPGVMIPQDYTTAPIPPAPVVDPATQQQFPQAPLDDFGDQFMNPTQYLPSQPSQPTASASSSQGLSDVTVGSRNVTVSFWDHGSEDGDRIDINLNGQPLRQNISLTKAKQSFNVTLQSGTNQFGVKALNEGSASPNTASVEISNVTSGRAVQVYSIKNGQSTGMNLIAPSSVNSGPSDYNSW